MDNVLIDSGASCNVIDYGTWNNLKQRHIKCESKVSDKKLFAYGQKEPMEAVGTFVAGIDCEASRERCVNEFTVIKSTGVVPSEEKIAAAVNTSEVQSFVQLVQYSSKFIPNFSQVAEPLRKLLRKGHPFVWGT